MPDDINDEVLFARSGTSHPLGKLCEIEKAPVPEIVSDVITQRARAAGMSRSELIRDVLCWWACPDDMERLLAERRRVAAMNRPGNGTDGDGDA
ncbi:ribbon-helix-helix protein, CopG family [Burkholderia sp. Ac-20345]|uniref:ribbon-helix-helix protein, CopG family n=1 Tax=Burkholderia sp. Ac-20345 TaxID=2703891 RepID=UPI00197C1F6D|nr:ribbon-helix-helix protein, CopG family [Burkholderia sp. Ac-20345]MBN3777415.1 ribbon-helix-helix protein, CopG family [Burkholderia sp. Ac-20345]